MPLTATEITTRLQQAPKAGLTPESPFPAGFFSSAPRPAAVLVPFVPRAAGWHLLFIRRATQPHDPHSGQVAFPGGRCNPEDADAVAAARREAPEEIGLRPEDVQILGQLRPMRTITNYAVTPVVGMIPWPYRWVAQPNEVARIFSIPLRWLADPRHREMRDRSLQFSGQAVPVVYFAEFEGEVLWGATARMVILLLEVLGLADAGERDS